MIKKLLSISVLLVAIFSVWATGSALAQSTGGNVENHCYADSSNWVTGKPPIALSTCDYSALKSLGFNMGSLPPRLEGCYFWPAGNAPGETAKCGDSKFANAQTIQQLGITLGAIPVSAVSNTHTDGTSGTTTGSIAATTGSPGKVAGSTSSTTSKTTSTTPGGTSGNGGASGAATNTVAATTPTPPGEVVNPVNFETNTNSPGFQCGGGEGNEVMLSINIGCKGKGNPILDALFAVIRFLTAGVGLVVIGSIVVGGIQYSASRGDPQATSKAVERITSSVVALLFFMFIYAILNWLVPAGLLK